MTKLYILGMTKSSHISHTIIKSTPIGQNADQLHSDKMVYYIKLCFQYKKHKDWLTWWWFFLLHCAPETMLFDLHRN